jgi:hypothetical protein
LLIGGFNIAVGIPERSPQILNLGFDFGYAIIR